MAEKTPIDAVKHKDRRTNIPTEELRGFVADDEKNPKKVLYPRDPALDPQLVWKGKDEQDGAPLEVEALPIYIQEKIHPQAIIEDLRNQPNKAKGGDNQLNFFSDFNGIEFEDLVDFYRHDQYWTNRMILGDSALVMTSLAEKEGLRGKVQTVYIDPPYGIKFGSNWQASTRKREVQDGRSQDASREPEVVKAFRDTWSLGIHSYLAYLRDRLVVSRELLTESGSIFVQIGDENVHLVRCLLDEVFGKENFVAEIYVEKTANSSMEFIDRVMDIILFYAKDRDRLKYRPLFRRKRFHEQSYEYKFVDEQGRRRRLTAEEIFDIERSEKTTGVYAVKPLTSQTNASTTLYTATFRGKRYESGKRQWATPVTGLERLIRANRVEERASSIGFVKFFDDFPVAPLTNSWSDTGTGSFTDPKVYVVQTGSKIVERCLLMTTDPGDLVLDPTCGSGTTAYVAEKWGRRWITIDTSRVALALARTRLMSARYPFYLLADTKEGILKEAEITGRIPPSPIPATDGDIRKGFVHDRVPHITLKSIANNPEIDAIHADWQEKLDPVRHRLNLALNENWEEWAIPKAANEEWPTGVQALFAEWWSLVQDRQKEIDAAIVRHADTETLHDKPYEDANRIRVAGPFTVESLSPHRVIPAGNERPASETQVEHEVTAGKFETMIIDNLKKAGVQNTFKAERLRLDRLEAYAGTWIHAAGEYSEAGVVKRVAVCIGPEHGTVGPDLIKEASKEAVQGLGFDLLLVCGFAFDPHVPEEAKRYGKLTVLVTRMNPDLAMGDEFLKKTGAGNLFMVFGEPDLDVRPEKDGRLRVSIRGIDIYDPTTGQLRSASPDEIACWFIDTNYNGESFFVRHAYFTGADEPYEKLRRALRAEIDEAAWESLYSTESRPFDKPQSGRIAVKVINHYGDEVLKVYNVIEANR